MSVPMLFILFLLACVIPLALFTLFLADVGASESEMALCAEELRKCDALLDSIAEDRKRWAAEDAARGRFP